MRRLLTSVIVYSVGCV